METIRKNIASALLILSAWISPKTRRRKSDRPRKPRVKKPTAPIPPPGPALPMD